MTLSLNKKTIIFILIAFIFSIATRMIWVYQFQDTSQFKFNNQFMINTNDGYYWAEGARDILSTVHQENDLSPVDTAAASLTAFIAKILPFSFESIIFYMPAFFASLLVIPVILIGRSIGKLEVGFIAALLSSIAWSYYNRTMVGYYDTDLLNIVFPTILLWSLMWAIKTQENKYFIFTALDIIAYRWWYPQSYALEFAFFGLLSLYAIYLYIKQKDFSSFNIIHIITLLTFMMFAMMQVDGYLRFVIVIGLFAVLTFKNDIFKKYLYYIFIVSILLFVATGGLDPIWGKLKGYVFKDHISTVGEDLELHFYTVMQTIREAGSISFETFANRISGHTITFIFSIIGYIWMTIRYPIMLLSLPLVGLGFLANGFMGLIPSGGLRFTIYAIVPLALGVAFLIVELVKLLNINNNKIIKYMLISLLTIGILYPNIKHAYDYRVPTVFNNNEVKVLDKLKSIASREDYVVGWWDYGYPIRYYSDVKTLSDGGKHSGSVNFATSFALTHPQDEAAKMLRFDVEYTENKFNMAKDDKDRNRTNIANMTLDYGFNDTNNFLTALQTDIKLPKKTRDIYLYLPNKMMGIYPTVNLFSNIDLMTGKKGKRPFFYKSNNFKESKTLIDLGRGIKIDKKTSELIIGNQKVKIGKFVKTVYNKQGKLLVDIKVLNKKSGIHVIYMANYKQFLVLEDSIFNSTYIKLFVLEEYDKNIYQQVITTPLAKVYKLKI